MKNHPVNLALLFFASTFSISTSASVWSNAELEVYNLVNQQRSLQNLDALKADNRLHQSALDHSADMGINNFFSHTGSDGSNPGERELAAGYNWNQPGGMWGENIAAGYGHNLNDIDAAHSVMYGTFDLTELSNFSVTNGKEAFDSWASVGTNWNDGLWDSWHKGWMGSSGHRANILSTLFADLGVGLYVDVNDQPFPNGGGPYFNYWTQNFAAGDSTTVVPLPSAFWLFTAGMTLLGANIRKRQA